jgi:hypothetical protein
MVALKEASESGGDQRLGSWEAPNMGKLESAREPGAGNHPFNKMFN